MVGFSSSPGPRRGGGTIIRRSGGSGYDVHNRGVLIGSIDGAQGVALTANGPLDWVSPHGLDGPPMVKIKPILTEIGTGILDLAGNAQQLDMMGEIEEATVLYIELRNLTGVPQAGFQGGFYLGKASDAGDPSAAAALIPWTTAWPEAALGKFVMKRDLAPPQRVRISAWYWRPKVKSTVPATAEYGIYAMPRWQKTWHGGPVKLKGD